MYFRLELVVVPVTDVDRTKAFYEQLGWSIDQDHQLSNESTERWTEGAETPPPAEVRFVQVTPPGSACSFCFGLGLEMMADGSSQFIQAVVEDADAALAELRGRGVDCRGVDEQAWGRFVYFEDPDGNRWALQQVVRPS